MLLNYLYILLASITVFLCLSIIISRNPVHAILFLVLLFVFLSIILAIFNLKFVAFILIVLYAGAISILFLFILLTFNLKQSDFIKKTIVSGFNKVVGFFILSKLFLTIYFLEHSLFSEELNVLNYYNKEKIVDFLFHTQLDLFWIGNLMYTQYAIAFLVMGIIILAAMIGVVAITKR